MRRFALRGLRSDEGLGLLETVVALFVFALIMAGLAGSMIAFAHSTALGRARASASALAQQLTEKARAVGGTLLENCSNVTPLPPATASFHGKTGLNVAQGTSTNCIKYQTTTTQDNISFSVTRLVIAAQDPQNDVSGNPQNEKYFVVLVSWTDAGGASKSYELDTIFTQKGTIQTAPAQGIRFVIKDTSGNIITADSASWAVAIKDSQNGSTLYTSSDAVTAEGTYSQLDLTAGTTYWCQATSTDDASAYYFPGSPSGSPAYNTGLTLSASVSGGANDTVGGSCTVTANSVLDFVTTWQSSTDCTTSSATGTYNFSVTDDSTPAVKLNGMTVTMTQVSDNTKKFTKTTSGTGTSAGQANGLKPTANWYTYTVTDPSNNYVTAQNVYGPVCVGAGTNISINVQMIAPACSTAGTANVTVNITVTDATTGNHVSNGYKVNVYNATTGVATALSNTNASGLATKNTIAPGLYYYMAAPPAGNTTYQGSGLLGTVCFATGGTYNYTVPLSAPTCTRGSGAGGKATATTVPVQDMAGASIPSPGATVTMISLDADGDKSKATTGGTVIFQNSGGDTRLMAGPYQFFVAGPSSSYLPKWVLTTFCATVSGTQTTPTVNLQGIMSVAVTVRNNDTIPLKTYQVNVIDSSGNTTSQSVSVSNCTSGAGCTSNPSQALVFSGLTTGNYYVQVCAQLKGNCNLIDTAPGQSGGTITYYQFLTPGTAYTSSTTGYGDLATVDDSGGA